MRECVFCRIANGEESAYPLYEDHNFIAFLDILPYGPGHTLVIPKSHYRWIWDVPNFNEYMAVVRKISHQLKEKMKLDTVYSLVFGEQIPHAHVHLIPPTPGLNSNLAKGFSAIIRSPIDHNQAVNLQRQLKLF